jgi:hypothetical protein
MILDTSLGWGYILKVDSDFTATITSPGSLNIGNVNAGKWTLYKRQYGISENTLPTMNERVPFFVTHLLDSKLETKNTFLSVLFSKFQSW